jgi:hypothetical protein
LLLLTTPVFGQGEIICCNQLINAGGNWVTSSRDCMGWMNQSTSNRRQVCDALACPASVKTAEPTDAALSLPAAPRAQAPASPLLCCDDVAALCNVTSCIDSPAATGHIYVKGYTSPVINSEPSARSPVVDVTLRDGSRYWYREAVRRGGQTWFHIGGREGAKRWVSGGYVSCTPPTSRSSDTRVWINGFLIWLNHKKDELTGEDPVATVPTGGKA